MYRNSPYYIIICRKFIGRKYCNVMNVINIGRSLEYLVCRVLLLYFDQKFFRIFLRVSSIESQFDVFKGCVQLVIEVFT